MKLTNDNYFGKENKYLSNSKVGDWLKDKRYFYNKHVLKIVKKEISDAMIIGSAVDTWLTHSKEKFEEKYMVVTRRSRKEDGKQGKYEYQLNNSMMFQIERMCESVERQKAYKEIKEEGFKSQLILQHDVALGHFDGLCGIPDWVKIDEENKNAVIRDLKTSKTINPVKYHYHCLDFGYYRQQAMYQLLIDLIYGIKECTSEHLVVEKDPLFLYPCQTFTLNQERIDMEKTKLLSIIEEIKGCKGELDFPKSNTSFTNSIEIGTL